MNSLNGRQVLEKYYSPKNHGNEILKKIFFLKRIHEIYKIHILYFNLLNIDQTYSEERGNKLDKLFNDLKLKMLLHS